MNKKIIEIFVASEVSNSQSSQSSSCGCNCSCCSTKSLTVSELVDRFTTKYDSVGEFKIYTLTSENKKDFISRLNKVFKDNGERLVVDESNFDFIISKVIPLITVDQKIISVKNYPDEDELYNAVMTGKKIVMKSACC